MLCFFFARRSDTGKPPVAQGDWHFRPCAGILPLTRRAEQQINTGQRRMTPFMIDFACFAMASSHLGIPWQIPEEENP
jgi:hypothetical protein